MKSRKQKLRDLIPPEYNRRYFISPGLRGGGVPRSVPKGRFLWHNQIMHYVGMPHGLNGFRYRHAKLPVNYRMFERCHCGVVDLPHYKMRGIGSGKCVSPEQVLPYGGLLSEAPQRGRSK